LTTIVRRIASGVHPAGTMLPKEELLAEEFDVSRGTVRETIRALEERGVVRVKHGRGATVAAPGEWNVLDPLVFSAAQGAAGGRRLVAEATEARSIVVREAAALAAERARPPAVQALTAAVDALEAAAGDRDVAAAELEFHRALGDAAGNRVLARIVVAAVEAMADAPPPKGEVGALRRIVDAVAAGDPAAARDAVRAHLRPRRSAAA
jgi:GntR family transcriptional regulator, galactonate operon transcriptional repressor